MQLPTLSVLSLVKFRMSIHGMHITHGPGIPIGRDVVVEQLQHVDAQISDASVSSRASGNPIRISYFDGVLQ